MSGRLPRPLFAGEVAERSDAGEGDARGTTLTLGASRLDLGPLFAAKARKRGEVYVQQIGISGRGVR